ncbi:Chromatin assembly factor 1 subunit rlf2 like protein [Verticillium longisporum]|uniref:Chromatin assembly factor 1 subunit rlf2 like protein n=1 Tax=Verticillium longisporum TaxID=100787 RepID=A0A8I2ZU06_VERLO|nr:Chromatin assembly factor 1 subunit rlf2 like protein [Verticillium longisporum]KAG7137705.1 Chromatin assembly factor 1 subunit rlf2 like protein [Verticillium longisporum]KAG7151033.1 Chromatin assembly factor 1 subunit rlf2 like protein [Verticillium longisporum]
MPITDFFTERLKERDPNILKRKSIEISNSDEQNTVQTSCSARARSRSSSLSSIASDDFQQLEKEASSTPKKARFQSSRLTASPGSLTDADSSRNSPSPNHTPTDITSSHDSKKPKMASSTPGKTAAPTSAPSKRKRITPAEKKAQEDEKEKKRIEREAKRRDIEEKKAKADAEKEEKKKDRDAKRHKKEEEARKVEEEKAKKERAQPKLNMFFKTPATPKKETPASETADKPAVEPKEDGAESPRPAKKQATKSEYEKLFKPFFVKTDVVMASNPFAMDEDAIQTKSRRLDEYISANDKAATKISFDPVNAFQFVKQPAARGRIHEPVQTIIERMRAAAALAESKSNIDEQEAIKKQTRERLSKIPMKVLCFQTDVRPPYRGTITLQPHTAGSQALRKIARKPTARAMPVDYDYDSEAEWVDEPGEDLDLDDEEEEDLDEGDEVAGLIDDSDAVEHTRFAASTLEPQSTGLCWENRKRLGPVATTYKHRLEFIVGDRLERNHGLDPFSTAYWESEAPAKAKAPLVDPTATAAAVKGDEEATKQVLDGISAADLLKIKKAIVRNYETTPRISRLGMLETLAASEVDGITIRGKSITRQKVKQLLDVMTERTGGKKNVAVQWSLRQGFEI